MFDAGRIHVSERLDVLDIPVDIPNEIEELSINDFNKQYFAFLDEYEMPVGGGGGGLPPIDEWPKDRGGRPEPEGEPKQRNRFVEFAIFMGKGLVKSVMMQGFAPENSHSSSSNYSGGPKQNKLKAGAIPENPKWIGF